MAALVGHFLGSQPFNTGPRMSPGGPVLPWPAHLCLLGFNLFQTLLLMCQLQMGAWHGHLPSTSTRITLCAAAVADLHHSLKEVQGKSRNEALCTWGWASMGGKTGLQIVQYFHKSILRAQFLYLPYLEKALTSFIVMTVSRD